MNNIEVLIKTLEINNIPPSIIAAMINSPASFYRKFSMPKRRGGIREINAPYPSLAIIQKKIYSFLKANFINHDAAFAFIAGKNAILHAEKHVDSVELLTIDISNFFSTINKKQLYDCLLKLNIDSSLCSYISSLCCLEDVLPQGAPSSPILSNIVFYKVDCRLNSLAKKLNIKYSRYADDLVFSGEKISPKLIDYVTNILNNSGYEVNTKKTSLKRRSSKKIITGISISSGTLKAPKNFKRQLRNQIHILEKNHNNISNIKPLDPLIYERILGKINYVLQIEPDNKFYINKKITLSEYHQQFLGRRKI